MLDTASYRDLKVVDIAREAGTSPATFYQYFTDVDAAIAELAGDMAADGATRLGELLEDTRWSGAAAEASVRALVTGFLGGLTTFSSFSAEVTTMLMEGRLGVAVVTAVSHLAGSLLLTWLGIRTVQTFGT